MDLVDSDLIAVELTFIFGLYIKYYQEFIISWTLGTILVPMMSHMKLHKQILLVHQSLYMHFMSYCKHKLLCLWCTLIPLCYRIAQQRKTLANLSQETCWVKLWRIPTCLRSLYTSQDIVYSLDGKIWRTTSDLPNLPRFSSTKNSHYMVYNIRVWCHWKYRL